MKKNQKKQAHKSQKIICVFEQFGFDKTPKRVHLQVLGTDDKSFNFNVPITWRQKIKGATLIFENFQQKNLKLLNTFSPFYDGDSHF